MDPILKSVVYYNPDFYLNLKRTLKKKDTIINYMIRNQLMISNALIVLKSGNTWSAS